MSPLSFLTSALGIARSTSSTTGWRAWIHSLRRARDGLGGVRWALTLAYALIIVELGLGAIFFEGCASRPNPSDPVVYRPAAPISYPQPR